ncbi:MAG: hypothetical protein Pg6C_12800 [Treponemataceae bacterium]|nr:MAG: hypothetical protein Pg6C_12800 [Treponemataceae bacterium]
MNSIQAIVILLLIFSFGEIIAAKTKAILSTTLVIAVVLLISFWCGLTPKIFELAQISGISGVLIGILLTSMGSLIDFPELKRQWKTVIIGFACVVCAVAAIIVVGIPVIGRQMAIAGAPIFAGANVATLIMTGELTKMNLPQIASFCVLVLVTQNFVGIPIASLLLRKEGREFVKNSENIKRYAKSEEAAGGAAKRKLLQLPKFFETPIILLTKLAVVAMVANKISALTGGKLNYLLIAMLLGILLTELGFLENNILAKTQSSAFIIFASTIIIFTTLAQTTPGQMVSMIGPLLLVLVLGAVMVIVVGFLVSKLLKTSPYLGISLGLTCTFGFPTTMLMSQEVANAMGSTEEEKTALRNYLLPKMIVAGFVTVTIVSVLVAGVVVGML